jgi:hypothetical protein
MFITQTLYKLPRAVANDSQNPISDELPLTPQDQKQLSQAQTQFEIVAQAIESQDDAPKTHRDVFNVTQQKLNDGQRDYSLSDVNLEVPFSQINDFSKDVKVSTSEDGLTFEMTYQNRKLRHTLPQFHPVSWTFDKEMMILANPDGKIYAIDLALAKNLLFKGPLPVFKVGTLPSYLLDNPELKLAFVKRSMDLPTKDHVQAMVPQDRQGEVYHAGDLLIYTEENGQKTRVGLLDRGVLTTHLSTAQGILATLAFQTSLKEEHESLLKPIIKLQSELGPKTPRNSAIVKDAFRALGHQAAIQLLAQAQFNAQSKNIKVDQFTAAEAQDSLQAEPASAPAKKSFKQISQSIFQPIFKPRTLAILAAATVGGYYAMDSVEVQKALAWSVYIVNELYDQYMPAVVKDSAYRITLLKSSVALSAFVPLLLGVGAVYNAVIKSSERAQKGIAAMSFRIYGAISLPFWHRIVSAMRQETFMKSLKEGVNPFMKVSQESFLGQSVGLTKDQRVGLNPVMGKSRNEVISKNSQILSHMVKSKSQLKVLTWKLALLAASEQTGYDPGTLTLALTENNMSTVLEKLSQDKDLQTKWTQLAQEFQITIMKMKKGLITEDVSKISQEELNEIYQLAVKTSQQIESRGKLAAFGKKLSMGYHRFVSSMMRSSAQFGISEYEFLKNSQPNDFVTNQMWQQFVTDYLLTVYQVAVIGDRANLSRPHDLAAMEDGLLYTSPGHIFDMINQVSIYGLVLPAQLGLLFQKQTQVREDSYAPIEDTSLVGASKKDGFGKGLWTWTKGATNLYQAKYSDLMLKDLVKKMRTIQAGFLITLVGRMAFGHQGFTDASLAYLFTSIWGTWQFGWIWRPITKGTQMLDAEYSERSENFKNAKTLLGQGLRVENPQDIYEGYKKLAAMYDVEDTSLPPEIRILVKNAGTVINPDSFYWKEKGTLTQLALTQRLQKAISSGDVQELESVSTQIARIYRLDEYQGSRNQDALELLIHALKNPPYATQYNHGVEWFTTMIAAVTTTYLGTSLIVDTFQTNISWGSKIGEATLLSAGIYTSLYFGQKMIENGVDKYDAWKAKRLEAKNAKLAAQNASLASQKDASSASGIVGALMCRQVFLK